MRIKGPADSAPPPVDSVGEAREATAPAPTTAVQPGNAVGEISAAGAITPHDVIAYVANRLRGGEMTPREAVELLIDDAVQRQVGGVTAEHAALANELKELLRRYTETDPYLASRVRRLGNRT